MVRYTKFFCYGFIGHVVNPVTFRVQDLHSYGNMWCQELTRTVFKNNQPYRNAVERFAALRSEAEKLVRQRRIRTFIAVRTITIQQNCLNALCFNFFIVLKTFQYQRHRFFVVAPTTKNLLPNFYNIGQLKDLISSYQRFYSLYFQKARMLLRIHNHGLLTLFQLVKNTYYKAQYQYVSNWFQKFQRKYIFKFMAHVPKTKRIRASIRPGEPPHLPLRIPNSFSLTRNHKVSLFPQWKSLVFPNWFIKSNSSKKFYGRITFQGASQTIFSFMRKQTLDGQLIAPDPKAVGGWSKSAKKKWYKVEGPSIFQRFFYLHKKYTSPQLSWVSHLVPAINFKQKFFCLRWFGWRNWDGNCRPKKVSEIGCSIKFHPYTKYHFRPFHDKKFFYLVQTWLSHPVNLENNYLAIFQDATFLVKRPTVYEGLYLRGNRYSLVKNFDNWSRIGWTKPSQFLLKHFEPLSVSLYNAKVEAFRLIRVRPSQLQTRLRIFKGPLEKERCTIFNSERTLKGGAGILLKSVRPTGVLPNKLDERVGPTKLFLHANKKLYFPTQVNGQQRWRAMSSVMFLEPLPYRMSLIKARRYGRLWVPSFLEEILHPYKLVKATSVYFFFKKLGSERNFFKPSYKTPYVSRRLNVKLF
uniref:Uncharacterized protein n=1 Tax=Chromera velia TaxID=505693 RepID=D9IXJ0_9ALVE|nr:hypothetical protein CHVEC_pgp057 [Chromera velia]ADJ66518.1 hypothetical protein [Chromera velia]